MREPTPRQDLYAYWFLNLKTPGKVPMTTEPQSGYYRCKRSKGGPWLPVAIWCHQNIDDAGELLEEESLRAQVDGNDVDAEEIWSWCGNNLISHEEYKHRTETGAWTSDPTPTPANASEDGAAAQPAKAVDLLKDPPSF